MSIPNDGSNVVSSELVGIFSCELVWDDNEWSLISSKSTKVGLILAIWVVLSYNTLVKIKLFPPGGLVAVIVPCTCNQYHRSQRPYRQPKHMQLPVYYIR